MSLDRLGEFLDSKPGLAAIVAVLVALLVLLWLAVRGWRGGRYTGRIISLAAIFLVSMAFLLLSVWFPNRGDVGAAGVPRLWVVGLVICCIYLLVNTIRGKEEPDEPATQMSLVFLFMGLAIGYLVVIPLLGYYLSTLLFLIAAIAVLGYRRWLRLLAVAGGWVLVVYVVFFRLLYVPLPEGMLVRLLGR